MAEENLTDCVCDYTFRMVISPADRRNIILEILKYERDLRQLAIQERKHTEKVKKAFDELEIVKERRKQTMIEHENANQANRLARLNEVEVREKFLKSLNFI